MNTMNSTSNNSNGGVKPGPARFFDTPAPGQFHSLALDTDDWESFVLVLEMRTGGMYPECEVVPGSMDVRKGGPDDLLIRHPDYEECWFLDLSQVRTVRADALLPGFAALTESELIRIRRELELYREKKESGRYLFGLPFIGETDSRRGYHANLGTLMENANKEAATRYWRRLASSFRIEPKKAGDDVSVSGRRPGIFDFLSKRKERESSSERRESGLMPQSGLAEMGLLYSISEISFLCNKETKRRGRELVELSFTPEAGELPGGEKGFILVGILFEEERIIVETVCETNPGVFDGIQLRRCSDRFVIGTILDGQMEADLVPEMEKGIYFARPGDIPLKGKWEER